MPTRRTLLIISLSILLGAGALASAGPRADLLWIMVDVSGRGLQGDAHLLIGGDGTTVLIDGGEYVNGRDRLVPLIRRQSVARIDTVFVTHAHFDHMGGVLALLDANVPVGEIFMHETTTRESCGKEDGGCRWREVEGLRARARDRGIPVRGFAGWSETRFGTLARLVKLAVFEQDACPVPCDFNDTSLIARLEVRGHRVLFAGDLNQPLGEWLVRERGDDLAADFLKVPHHGTEGTAPDAFFQRVRPRFSFVPSPTTLWCSERSARVRNQLARLSEAVYVSEPHGDVFTSFFADGTYRITETRAAPRPCG